MPDSCQSVQMCTSTTKQRQRGAPFSQSAIQHGCKMGDEVWRFFARQGVDRQEVHYVREKLRRKLAEAA